MFLPFLYFGVYMCLGFLGVPVYTCQYTHWGSLTKGSAPSHTGVWAQLHYEARGRLNSPALARKSRTSFSDTAGLFPVTVNCAVFPASQLPTTAQRTEYGPAAKKQGRCVKARARGCLVPRKDKDNDNDNNSIKATTVLLRFNFKKEAQNLYESNLTGMK